VTELDRRIRAGEKIARPDVLAVETLGKTVGVVGVGNIGSRVARNGPAHSMQRLSFRSVCSDFAF